LAVCLTICHIYSFATRRHYVLGLFVHRVYSFVRSFVAQILLVVTTIRHEQLEQSQ